MRIENLNKEQIVKELARKCALCGARRVWSNEFEEVICVKEDQHTPSVTVDKSLKSDPITEEQLEQEDKAYWQSVEQ